MADLYDLVVALNNKIEDVKAPADREKAIAVRNALTKLSTDAQNARVLAEQFRAATSTQKNNIVQQRFDDVLDSLADTYDIIGRLIRAVVKDQTNG